MTFRELIDRRWKRIKIVVVPLLLAALVLIGNDPPWTTANCIGVAVFLIALIVIIACVGTVRCPLCQRFIGPGTACGS
jgi:energy-coupling factor transporter transmembrane protein EcfT